MLLPWEDKTVFFGSGWLTFTQFILGSPATNKTAFFVLRAGDSNVGSDRFCAALRGVILFLIDFI